MGKRFKKQAEVKSILIRKKASEYDLIMKRTLYTTKEE